MDGEPYLALAGELGNNTATSLEHMQPIWPRLRSMNLNTVLPAISWALTEPEEGNYDFTLVDGLIEDARRHNMKLVPLWFGSWKNTWSSYAPEWVKRDFERFPRVRLANGSGTERLSPFSDANRDADARAFAALMRHIKEVDGDQHTVIMVQVENEVGVIPDARDHSEVANKAFNGPVPAELMDYLQKHKEILVPELRAPLASHRLPILGLLGGGVRRRPGNARPLHGLALRSLHRQSSGGRQGRVQPADVRECGADSNQLRAGPV